MIIYGLFDPRAPDELRWIGATRGPLWGRHQRAWQHKYLHKTGPNPGLREWIGSLRAAGVFVGIVELARPEGDGFKAERFWIRHYQRLGHRLFNVHHKDPTIVVDKDFRLNILSRRK